MRTDGDCTCVLSSLRSNGFLDLATLGNTGTGCTQKSILADQKPAHINTELI